jgi:hypothetical protein
LIASKRIPIRRLRIFVLKLTLDPSAIIGGLLIPAFRVVIDKIAFAVRIRHDVPAAHSDTLVFSGLRFWVLGGRIFLKHKLL